MKTIRRSGGIAARSVVTGLAFLFACNIAAVAQDEAKLKQRVLDAYDRADGLIFPPEINRTVEPAGPDVTRDNIGELKKFLDGNPDASFICAALMFGGWGTRYIASLNQLRGQEIRLCQSYPHTWEQKEKVLQWIAPPAPSRREQISAKFPPRNLDRFLDFIYTPPPASPMDWFHGDLAGRNYGADARSAFDRDPLLAAYACVHARRAFRPQLNDRQRELLAALDQVCDAFPDAKIEAAVRERISEQAHAWLNGLMNSMFDAAATLSADARRQQAEEFFQKFSKIASSGTRGFETGLRIIALAPDDWRGPATALRYKLEPTLNDPPGSPAELTMAWLEDLYAKNAAAGTDVWQWKRGQRAFLTLTGQVKSARKLAAEIEAHADDQHALDVIYLAMLDRALGSRTAYDRLMQNCPAPDPRYVLQYGAPARPAKYCEDVVAGFAGAVRDRLDNAPLAAEFARMSVETNRVAPTTVISGATSNASKRTITAVLDDWFSSLVHQREDIIAKMDKVQREETGGRLYDRLSGCMCLDFSEAVEVALLRPWHESGTAQLVYQAHMSQLGEPENEKYVRKLVGDFIAARAASGPDAAEWKRSLRAFYLFTGDYTRARDLSRELIKTSQPPYAIRDSVLLGLTERIFGNRGPLDHAVATCPGRPKEQRDRLLDEEELPKGDFCRNVLNSDLMRAIRIADGKPLPKAFSEILNENATQATHMDIREFALRQLTEIDPDDAALRWRELLDIPHISDRLRQSAYFVLAQLSEKKKQWREGIQWIDRYIDETETPAFFTPQMWNLIAQQEETVVGSREDASTVRLRLALGAADFESARRTIEDLAALGDPARVCQIRESLIRLANAEIDAGQREEPLRIIGYVARQPLSMWNSPRLAETRARLSAAGEQKQPKREDSPWDSPPRKRQPSPAPLAPLKKT